MREVPYFKRVFWIFCSAHKNPDKTNIDNIIKSNNVEGKWELRREAQNAEAVAERRSPGDVQLGRFLGDDRLLFLWSVLAGILRGIEIEGKLGLALKTCFILLFHPLKSLCSLF